MRDLANRPCRSQGTPRVNTPPKQTPHRTSKCPVMQRLTTTTICAENEPQHQSTQRGDHTLGLCCGFAQKYAVQLFVLLVRGREVASKPFQQRCRQRVVLAQSGPKKRRATFSPLTRVSSMSVARFDGGRGLRQRFKLAKHKEKGSTGVVLDNASRIDSTLSRFEKRNGTN